MLPMTSAAPSRLPGRASLAAMLLPLLLVPAAVLAGVVSGFPSAHAGQAGSSPETDARGRAQLEEMIENVKREAEAGNPEAQYVHGTLFGEDGAAEAARWFRRAAEQGHARAQAALGASYLEGLGVPKDEAEAARWFRRAADLGNADAQYLLGHMYRDGRGVPRDAAASAAWFRKAAERGHPEAQYRLSKRLAPRVSRQEILGLLGQAPGTKPGAPPSAAETAEARARREQQAAEAETWLRRAADAGHPDAWHDLADIETDKVEALKWLYLLANHPEPPPDALFGLFRKVRDLERALGPEKTAEAQRLAAEWAPRRTGTAPREPRP